ncbi:uncharacterized protein LOC106646497 [Copidosoma floridanum]|uniref:uncharacterized protein LOC106646497 n=1 Tax=Copidosoma floridanum TaxID=29053 RepID=UPI000C6F9495|nr:uncharacterized protein LOC106646497 [Copidosoma floridanum]
MSRRTAPLVGLNSCERIRPERPRNAIQRLVWVPGSQYRGGFVAVCDDDGSNPRMAIRRLVRLYEGRQYREAASFLMRLPHYTLRAALPDIPIDLLIDTLPHSLALLEALYARLIELGVRDTKVLRLELLLWKVVGILANPQPDHHFQLRAWARLLSALNRAAPSARAALASRRRTLERTVEGLGKHGLVATSKSRGSLTARDSVGSADGDFGTNLVPLRQALKEELEVRADAYKLALHKIEGLGKHAGLHKGDHQGLQAASHQRLLALSYSEVQQRLIDNQSLLNTLEKTRHGQLDCLLDELKSRVQRDKEALRQWSALRRNEAVVALAGKRGEANGSKNTVSLAAGLLQFSRGCALAMQLMSGDNDQSFSSGDHYYDEYGEEDEEEEESSSSAGYHTDESCSPTPEPAGHEAHLFQGLHCPDVAVERLRERYAGLYSQAYSHTLEALNRLEPLRDTPELKTRILYSVVVLSWRLAGILQASRRIEALRILNGGSSQSQPSVPADLEDCIRRQLATAGAQSGAREVAQQVTSQFERTLSGFPCLRSSTELKKYVFSCSRLAWACLARSTSLVLDVAQGTEFRHEVHARHQSSPNSNGTRITAVLWPGLREGCQGPYLHRAVVITC